MYRTSRNAANIALRHAKRDYYATNFQNYKNYPKHAWKTINDILGRNHNQNVINEIKFSGKSVTSTFELEEVFTEYFTDTDPKLAQTINHDSDSNFEDIITKRQSTGKFSFETVNEFIVCRLITN